MEHIHTAACGAVLAVEDDPRQLELLVMALRCWPFEVSMLKAPDGATALEQLERIPVADFGRVISLVLLGLRLPRLLGLELLARACECGLTALTPFIVFTSADNAAERARALQRGARDYLVKPLGLGPLKRLVTKLYDRWIAPSTSASG